MGIRCAGWQPPSFLRGDLRDRVVRGEQLRGTSPGGEKQPNAFGLYDMLGNVSEWVLDRYFNKYSYDSVATGPEVEQPLASNATAVARGGSGK